MLIIKNGRIHIGNGEILENASLAIENGKIISIKAQIECSDGDEVIDARGKNITPGLIDAHCHIGLWENGIGFEGADGNESTNPITPQLRAIDGINPLDSSFREAYEAGVTTAMTGPGSINAIGGQFAVIKTYGHRVDNMILKSPAAIKISFGENPKTGHGQKGRMPVTRMGIAALIRETLVKAQNYGMKKESAAQSADKPFEKDLALEALLLVLNREIPLKAHVHRADDIFTAIRIAEEFNVRLTLDHVTEGHLIVDDLLKEKLPLIVGPSFGGRGKFELKEKTFKTPGILSRAGIDIALCTDHPVIPLHNLINCAAFAVKDGMDEEEALKAITLNPAKFLGVSDRVGSLKVGKDADIIIFDGDIFDIMTSPEMVIIDGQIVFNKNVILM